MHGTRRTLALALMLAAAVSSPAAVGQRDASQDTESYLNAVDGAFELAMADRSAEACAAVRALEEPEGFQDMQEIRALALARIGYIYLGCDEYALALGALRTAAETNPQAWVLANLSIAAGQVDAPAESARAMIQLAARYPDKLSDATARRATVVFSKLNDDPALQRELYQAFFDARFEMQAGDNSAMWVELARLHLEAGDADPARMVVSRVVGGSAVMRMRADRRFDPIVVRDARAFDPRHQAERLVELLERQAVARPRDVSVWVQLAYAKLALGDHQAVIDDTTRVLDAVAPAGDAAPTARDWQNVEQYPWLLDLRARAHVRLGRIDAALADLERAAATVVDGEPNINQALNLANLYCLIGRPADAMRRVGVVGGELSTYGQLVQGLVRLCAAVQRGDVTEATALSRQVRTLAGTEFPVSALRAQLWEGDLPGAERTLLAALQDPAKRQDALEYVQDYTPTPGLSGRAPIDRNRAALLARPAVIAAIDKVGRVERVDLFLGTGFD